MDSAAKIPLSHTLWSPHDTVKDAAELLGITLPEDAAKNLAMDVEYRIHEILETAIKFMRHSKRRLLTTSDFNNALKVLNIEPLFGYDQSQPLVFKEALFGAGGQTLYYIDDNEIEFEKLINQELPKVPRQTTFTAHWLAIEGVQPMIPQNPLALEIKNLPPIVRGATSSVLSNDVLGNSSGAIVSEESKNVASLKKKNGDKDVEVKPLVKHVLSKELKLYFDKVVEVLVLTAPEKESLREAALSSLRTDPGLHQLVPYFIQFVAEQITNHLRNIDILITMLDVISALYDNKTIFLAPYVHALMPCILTLLLAKRIGTPIKDAADDEAILELLKGQFAVREFASLLLEHVINAYGSSYSTLKPRVTRTLLRALLDSSKPIGTQYGALLGLEKLGPEVIKLVLVGNLKLWYKLVIENSDKSQVEKKLLEDKVLEVLDKSKVDVTASDSSMDVDTEISEETKTKLKERIGEPLALLVLEHPNALGICQGMFFGELTV
ncbi:CIC11C00000003538 [Sungouiella intermedia]|uniref:TBP-associated factor 6 n=1 Tax=Sungouiella intermedia TaxID=45354 RepID=A0A1L0GRC7_9ASCO|nr:CIC11C00000003538 [[Candida] intermedia]